MKFKIGDKVRVKTWDEMAKEFGVSKNKYDSNKEIIPCKFNFVEEMKPWCGRLVEIIDIYTDIIRVKDVETLATTKCIFSEDMLKPLEKKYTFDGFFKIPNTVYFDEHFEITGKLKPKFLDSYKLNWVVNREKKTIVLYNKFNRVIIKCHEEDTFNLEIGVGLALSKFFDCKKYRAMREFFRNKRKKLNYKKYAAWVILDYCNYNSKEVEEYLKNIKEMEKENLKEIEKENPNDLVTVIDDGESYTTYKDWFSLNKLEGLLKRYDYSNSAENGKEYKVLAQGKHEYDKELTLYAIEDVDTKKVYLVGEKGLKFKK